MAKSTQRKPQGPLRPPPLGPVPPPPGSDPIVPPPLTEDGEPVPALGLDPQWAEFIEDLHRNHVTPEMAMDALEAIGAPLGQEEIALPYPAIGPGDPAAGFPPEWENRTIEIQVLSLRRFLTIMRQHSRAMFSIAARGTHLGAAAEIVDAVRKFCQMVCKQTPALPYCEWGAGCLPTPTSTELWGAPEKPVRPPRAARAPAARSRLAAGQARAGRPGGPPEEYHSLGMFPDGRNV